MLAMEGSLVGMSLLHGSDVRLRVVAGGAVTVSTIATGTGAERA